LIIKGAYTKRTDTVTYRGNNVIEGAGEMKFQITALIGCQNQKSATKHT
jgi:hypothetical protein